ncbi:hypothetical protein LEN26_020371 [Aphanomyces euteiches]|nr:hypothetical protein LEN26_020371 [Aphanomyces euteiches]KAH9129441.1 hypothetical protein AeMF1_000547 [Aphanomyces euteiches]KAH9196516.1 hypothetical protein AeNC1_001491 [Aphanomyces euteiches]
MSVNRSGCSPPTGSNSTSVPISPPIDRVVQLTLIAFVIAGIYAPVAIVYYFLHRNNPTIRFRSPVDVVIAATCAFIYSSMRCLNAIFVDKMSCSLRYLSLGIPLHFTVFAFAFAQLKVIITFNLTELMVAHAELKQGGQAKMAMLRIIFRLLKWTSIPRLIFHSLANAPLFWILLTAPYDPCDPTICPISLAQAATMFLYAELGISILLTFAFSFGLSRVVDNFGLRDDFQRSARVFLFIYSVYFPTYVLFSDTMTRYRLNVMVDASLGHIFICIHILLPLRNVGSRKRYYVDPMKTRGSVGGESKVALFHMYLATPDGFRDFSWFAQSEFMYETVVAWKNIMDYRQAVEGHLSVVEIYQKHIAPRAPLSLNNVVRPELLSRFAVMIAANHKYNVQQPESDDGINREYFDPLLRVLREQILTETLPRYQRHPLGVGWRNFLTHNVVKNTLETLLQPDAFVPKTATTPQTLKKTSLTSIKTNGRLFPIASDDDSCDSSDQPYHSTDMAPPRRNSSSSITNISR